MENMNTLTLLVIVANGLMTYSGLNDVSFFNRFAFNVGHITQNRDYKRLVTSGFLHADWSHFAFNMFTLYFFSDNVIAMLGKGGFLLVYFGSLIFANLFSLFIHRHQPYYTAIGASGAVSGLVFASIGLFPGLELGFLFLPFYIPAWLFGLGYVIYSIYGMRAQNDNIGHDAHLGGGVIGLLIAIALVPSIVTYNYLPIVLILVPSFAYLVYLIRKES